MTGDKAMANHPGRVHYEDPQSDDDDAVADSGNDYDLTYRRMERSVEPSGMSYCETDERWRCHTKTKKKKNAHVRGVSPVATTKRREQRLACMHHLPPPPPGWFDTLALLCSRDLCLSVTALVHEFLSV